MMSGLILLFITDQPPVIFILLPQSLRFQPPITDTQSAKASSPLTVDGFMCPLTVTQICHSPFFHCTSRLKKAEADSTSSWDAHLETLFIRYLLFVSFIYYLNAISDIAILLLCSLILKKSPPKIIYTSW